MTAARRPRPNARRRPRAGTRRSPLRLIPHIHRATHRIGLWLESRSRAGITQAESHILAHMAAAGPSTVAELHAALAHRRSTLTSVLDRLEERRFVRRTVAPEDRRSVLVELTASGETNASRTHAVLAALEEAALAPWSAAQVKLLARVLDGMGRTDLPSGGAGARASRPRPLRE